MGCICSTEVAVEDRNVSVQKNLVSDRSLKHLISMTSKDEPITPVANTVAGYHGNNGWVHRTSSKARDNTFIPVPVAADETAKKAVAPAGGAKRVGVHWRRATMDISTKGLEQAIIVNDADPSLAITGVPNGFSGEHVIAGWPSWLTDIAPEVVQGWLPRRADTFERLDKIGQGTYSNVYKARDLNTGRTVALKRVRFANMDPESVRFMAREIVVLRSLNHPNVIKLGGVVTSRLSTSIYLIFEYMEHDLSGLTALPGLKFTESQVKCLMQQLLNGLQHCHARRVLHRDIKGSNLLISDDGVLKIADFGLATFYNPDQRKRLTSHVVTLWYRPPELLLGATEYGVAVDLWSTGCILAELLAGKPILPGRTEIEQLHKIFKLCGSPSEEYWAKSKLPDVTLFRPQQPYRRRISEVFKDFPPSALTLLESLLAIEPAERGTTTSALQSQFFRNSPLACDPASLPKFPPSKEYDVKLREIEAKRQREATLGGQGSLSLKPDKRQATTALPDTKMDLQARNMSMKAGSGKYAMNGNNTSTAAFHEPPGPLAAMPTIEFGSSWYKKGNNQDDHRAGTLPPRPYGSLRVSNGPALTKQQSYAAPQSQLTDSFMGLGSSRGTSRSRYNRLDVTEPYERSMVELAMSMHPASSSSYKRDLGFSKDSVTVGGAARKARIHYSGPLMPPGGNMEEMLREHERQMQQAVRKARIDKEKTSTNYY